MPDAAPSPATPLPLPADGFGSWGFWKKEIQASESKRDDDMVPMWNRNLQSYLAKPNGLTAEAINPDQLVTPKDFANVEQKKAQLFFQLPKIILKALQPQFEQAAPIAQAVIRFYLGPNRVDAVKMMAECLFDALCPAGLMACKVGYESVQDGTSQIVINVPAPSVAPPAPALGEVGAPGAQAPGSILGLGAQPPTIPIQQEVPRIISERYFVERISPAKVLIPEGFHGSNYDLAHWNGQRFEGYADVIRRRYQLEDDAGKGTSEDEHRLKSEANASGRTQTQKITGWEIWYKAAIFDPNEKHPEKIRLLVILDGYDEPVVHKDSPYQVFDEKTGRLVRGMRGFPIQIGALRYVSDSAYPPSECTIGRALVENLSRFDTQSATMRDRAVSFLLADIDRIGGPSTLEKMRRGIFGGIIGVHGLDSNNPPLHEAAKPHLSTDHYQTRNQLDRDLSEVWAFGPNQRGQEASESRSATEMRIAQGNATARLSAERRETMDFFVKCASKLFALIQLFADKEEFVEIVGEDGEKRYESWDKTKIAGEYAFEIKPDSAAQIDYVQERGDLLRAYELIRRDPNVNAIPLLERIATAFDFDPYGQAGLVVSKLPPKPPKPAEIAMSMKLEDLDMGDPLFEIKLSLLQQSGYVFAPEMIAKAQQHRQAQALIMAHSGINDPGLLPAGASQNPTAPNREHPGAANQVERLNKHTERATGGVPNAPAGIQ